MKNIHTYRIFMNMSDILELSSEKKHELLDITDESFTDEQITEILEQHTRMMRVLDIDSETYQTVFTEARKLADMQGKHKERSLEAYRLYMTMADILNVSDDNIKTLSSILKEDTGDDAHKILNQDDRIFALFETDHNTYRMTFWMALEYCKNSA